MVHAPSSWRCLLASFFSLASKLRPPLNPSSFPGGGGGGRGQEARKRCHRRRRLRRRWRSCRRRRRTRRTPRRARRPPSPSRRTRSSCPGPQGILSSPPHLPSLHLLQLECFRTLELQVQLNFLLALNWFGAGFAISNYNNCSRFVPCSYYLK